MKIVEFIGYPCCGKSFLSHKLFTNLSKSFTADESIYIFSHNKPKFIRGCRKILFFLFYFFKHLIFFFRSLALSHSLLWVINLFYLLETISHNKKKDFVFLEQGITQVLTIIPFKKFKKIDNFLNSKNFKRFSFFVFDIHCEKNTIKKRIALRNAEDDVYKDLDLDTAICDFDDKRNMIIDTCRQYSNFSISYFENEEYEDVDLFIKSAKSALEI